MTGATDDIAKVGWRRVAVLVPLQVLHGITYGASHIGAIHFIHDAIPRDKSGSAQALYATVACGIAMGCA